MTTQLVQYSVAKVYERGQPQCIQEPTHGPGEAKLGEEQDTPTPVASHQRAVAENEPPALGALFLGHRGEQALGLFIGERQ